MKSPFKFKKPGDHKNNPDELTMDDYNQLLGPKLDHNDDLVQIDNRNEEDLTNNTLRKGQRNIIGNMKFMIASIGQIIGWESVVAN